MQTVRIPVKRLDETLDMPAYAYVGDAGLDLRAAEDAVLAPFERKLVSCGIAIAIPQGYAGFVLPRSGLAAKHGISIVNRAILEDRCGFLQMSDVIAETMQRFTFSTNPDYDIYIQTDAEARRIAAELINS